MNIPASARQALADAVKSKATVPSPATSAPGPPPQKTHVKKAGAAAIAAIVLLSIAVIVISAVAFENASRGATWYARFQEAQSSLVSAEAVIGQYEKELKWMEQPTPANGKIFPFTDERAQSTFEITTPRGDQNYYLLLKSAGKKVIGIFVRPGRTVSAEIPAGSYSAYLSSGVTWYGEYAAFGLHGHYEKLDGVFSFERQNGCTLKIGVSNGNLSSSDISFHDFAS